MAHLVEQKADGLRQKPVDLEEGSQILASLEEPDLAFEDRVLIQKAPLLQAGTHKVAKLLGIERFYQVISRAVFQGLDGRLQGGVTGDEDHLRRILHAAGQAQNFHTAQPWHDHIGQNDVDAALPDPAQGVISRGHRFHLIAVFNQKLGVHATEENLVVHHQYG